eukprot:NODE_2931_length_844_cov_21.189937_g2428_i0.p2 GENE.NODE_2931_length_844_cov_21.189937_g2428_i0~~NODE_2931_length_844_cov_21.189937_g2428_i0.p2  ORF type:complete len:79 (+),score=10.84 NODE_2931_length_844_cov_21.189937_g2428_i0:594-830(+)
MESMQQFARSIKPNGGFFYAGICLDEILHMKLHPEQPEKQLLPALPSLHPNPQEIPDDALCEETSDTDDELRRVVSSP